MYHQDSSQGFVIAMKQYDLLPSGVSPRTNAFGDRGVQNDSDSEDSMSFTAGFHNNTCQMRLPWCVTI